MHDPRPAKDVFDGFAAPFALNQDAGIEDQAQSVNPTPTYREACERG